MNTVVYPLYIFMYTKIAVCMFQGPSGKLMEGLYNIIPGREFPKWFEKVNICRSYVVTPPSRFTLHSKPFKTKKVKIQLPGSGSGCDGWRGIVLCVLFLPSERCQYSINEIEVDSIKVDGCQMSEKAFLGNRFWRGTCFNARAQEYGKVESHHIWLYSTSSKTLGCSVDEKRFHQVELKIASQGLEVEQIGFRVV